MSYHSVAQYWASFKALLPMFLLVSIVAAGVALVIARQLPVQHQAHFSYSVSLAVREQSTEYQFDGFYALQATDLFTATLASWAQAPEMVAAAYRAGGLELPTQDPRRLVRSIEARKVAPQLVEITIRETDAARAQQLIEGLKIIVGSEVERYHTESIPELQFRVTATEPWHGERTVARPVIVTATFLFTFFILVNGWLLFIAFASPTAAGQRAA